MGSHNKETTLLKATRENARRMPRGNRRKRGRRRGRRGGNLVICFSSLDSIIPFRSKQPKMPRLPLSLLLLTQLSHFFIIVPLLFCHSQGGSGWPSNVYILLLRKQGNNHVYPSAVLYSYPSVFIHSLPFELGIIFFLRDIPCYYMESLKDTSDRNTNVSSTKTPKREE